MPDNGDLGIHHKVEQAVGIFTLDSADRSRINPHLYLKCTVKVACTAKYIPIPENIKGNDTPFRFNAQDKVLVSNLGYMKYVFVLALDKNGVVGKYGWVPREYIKN